MKILAFIVCLLVPLIGAAHHSDAGIDENTVLSFEAKVTEFSWRQPHVYLEVDAIQDGELVRWVIQFAGINALARQGGWRSDSLKPGDDVFVRLNPAENGRPYGKISSIQRLDGSPVAVPPGEIQNNAKAKSLEGSWIADRNRLGPSYPGGFDGFFREQLVLTQAGKNASEDYDPLSPENPESTCVGRPTPSAFVSTSGYLYQFDLSGSESGSEEKIVIHSEWFNEQRTVYMDGREHPDPSETFAAGHSIGYWDEDTLVVDTHNFDDHRSPYQIGVPSGAQKHVIEKYRLIEDGAAMYAEFTLEDPEYLAEPLFHSRVLLFSPQLEMLIASCDIESTSRFLK